MNNFESVSRTDDELIARALEIRDDIEAMKKKAADELEPYEMALQDIENALLARLVARGGKSSSTPSGTAYLSEQLRVKVADRGKFLHWVMTNEKLDFITNHVSKEAVKEYLEQHQAAPPGVDTTKFTQCNIRKA